MNITINSQLIGGVSDYKINRIDGLGKPPIRTSSQNFSGRHGGRVNRQLHGARLITVTGWFSHTTCSAHEAARDALDEALPIEDELEVIVERFSGEQGFTNAYVVDFQMPYADAGIGKLSDFKIDLLCGDPNFYIGAELSATLSLFAPGGVVLPIILPATFAAGSGDTSVSNAGSIETFPIITLTGVAHNPEFTNTDTGESIAVPITMGSGDVLVIDMARHTITLNGSNVLGLATSHEWFALSVGANHIRYETTDAADTGTAVITWRNAVRSI